MVSLATHRFRRGRRVPGDVKLSPLPPATFKHTNFLPYLFLFIYKYFWGRGLIYI